MPQLNASILTVAALLLIAASMALNWSYWTAQATAGLAAQIFGAVSLAADAFKAGLPFVIRKAARGKHKTGVILATMFFCGCLVFSFLSALGFALTNRSEAAGALADMARRYEAASAELKDLQAHIAADSTARAGTVIAEAIAKAQQDRHWTSSSACTDASLEASRSFCQKFADLKIELAEAKDRDALLARAETLTAEMTALSKSDGRDGADAQVNLLARLSGLEVRTMQTALSLLFALLVEFGAAFGLFLAAVAGSREPALAGPEQAIARAPLSTPRRRQLRAEGGRLIIS